jgi:hypothetical protein
MPSAPFNAAALQRRLNRSSDKIAQVKRSTLLLASKDISVLWNAPPVLFERLTQDGQDGHGRRARPRLRLRPVTYLVLPNRPGDAPFVAGEVMPAEPAQF